jgi:hypothetical protein
MLRRLIPSPSMVVALAALFVALSGSAYAALVITGHNIKNGTVTGADIKNNSLASKDIKHNSIGGVAIKESALGTVPVANAAEGMVRWAVVSASGQLIRSHNVTSVARTSSGRYQVVFNRDVRNCAYIASLGDPSASGPSTGLIATSSLPSNVNGVAVRTAAPNGDAGNRSFHLIVPC